jgi:hypothetical protein
MLTIWQESDLLKVCCEFVHKSRHIFQLGCQLISRNPESFDSNIPAPVSSVEEEDVLVLEVDIVKGFLVGSYHQGVVWRLNRWQ